MFNRLRTKAKNLFNQESPPASAPTDPKEEVSTSADRAEGTAPEALSSEQDVGFFAKAKEKIAQFKKQHEQDQQEKLAQEQESQKQLGVLREKLTPMLKICLLHEPLTDSEFDIDAAKYQKLYGGFSVLFYLRRESKKEHDAFSKQLAERIQQRAAAVKA